jgi:hypothetical protein
MRGVCKSWVLPLLKQTGNKLEVILFVEDGKSKRLIMLKPSDLRTLLQVFVVSLRQQNTEGDYKV